MMIRRLLSGALMVAALGLAGSSAQAVILQSDTNLVTLLKDAQEIVVADVLSVTDGIDENGLPYTEITVGITEALRGDSQEGSFSFRQLGLLNPRTTADGTRKMPAAPEWMPKYAVGDRVLLFLGPAASMTGLRSPIGLGSGKFTFRAGAAENESSNKGVFSNVSIAAGLATDNDLRLLATTVGAVNPDALLSLVRRATQQNWVATCKMWNTDEGPTCGEVSPTSGAN